MKSVCLICEKWKRNWRRFEGDFAVCDGCYDNLLPYLIRETIRANDNILNEVGKWKMQENRQGRS